MSSNPESTTASRAERRKYPRQLCGPDHPLRIYVGSNRLPVQVRDVSVGGVGLLLSHRLAPGATLPVKLATQDSYVFRHLQVQHVTELAPTCCIVGCSFDPQLNPEELQAVLS